MNVALVKTDRNGREQVEFAVFYQSEGMGDDDGLNESGKYGIFIRFIIIMMPGKWSMCDF